MRVACILPTYNAERTLERLLVSLKEQDFNFDLHVIDSSSIDKTQKIFESMGIQYDSVESKRFNHGGTRQWMVEKYHEYEFYVFVTQDIILVNKDSISRLLDSFKDEKVGAVYGRQLPHDDANLSAQHARLFNYPKTSVTKSGEDITQYGIKTPFLSNSFSAYRRTALEEVGGFPSDVILSEDMYVGAKLINSGWCIRYEALAQCKHSHNYTLRQEFKRYFDIGVFAENEKWIFTKFGGTKSEGLRFVLSEIKYVLKRKPLIILGVALRAMCKYGGFNLGSKYKYFSRSVNEKLSMNKKYWNSNRFIN